MVNEEEAVKVCNDALLELGQKVPVERLTVDDAEIGGHPAYALRPNEAVCASKFELSRRGVLRAHPWGFATRFLRVLSTPVFGGGADGFRFRFRRPAACIRVLVVDGHVAFTVAGDWVYTRRPAHVVKYVEDVDDVGGWPAEIRDVLVKRLAADIAVAVTGNSALVSMAEQKYAIALGDAKRLDAAEGRDFDFEGMDPISASMEGAVPRFDDGPFLDAVEGRVAR